MLLYLCLLSLLFLASATYQREAPSRSFVIDYDNNRFLKDGQPYRYISGSIHYFRVPEQYWEDRLYKMKAGGLNALEFYIPWNWHAPSPGNFTFSGPANVTRFLDLAQGLGLDVILRIGPYTCGEWENGGFPWWLLKIQGIEFRKSNAPYITEVQKWFAKLLPMIRPKLYKNGGPIIMVQVENEYGSWPACDRKYMTDLRDLVKQYLHDEVVLFTVDGGATSYLKCGATPGLYPTVDFGPQSTQGVKKAFAAQRQYAPKGPLVNSEFYPGWLDIWGKKWNTGDTTAIVKSMQDMYAMNASFNFYMYHGGTNFGHWASGMGGDPWQTVTTSYDYDAPLSEAGDPTPKLVAIRSAIENLTGKKINIPIPPVTNKKSYGMVNLLNLGPVSDLLNVLSPPDLRARSDIPRSFEDLNFPYGFVLYETHAERGTVLNGTVHDRGYVMQDGAFVGMLTRGITTVKLPITHLFSLQILVENSGRRDNGVLDPKGILGDMTLDGSPLNNWKMFPITFDGIFESQGVKYMKKSYRKSMARRNKISLANYNFNYGLEVQSNFTPSVYWGTFAAPEIADTFLDTSGWGKGQIYINGNNIGRYWPTLGPQVTLYVPKYFLKPVNTIVVFELEKPGLCKDSLHCGIQFVTEPKLNKTGMVEKFNSDLEWEF